MSDATYALAALAAGIGSEAAGVTDVTPIGRDGDDDSDSGPGGGGGQIIPIPGDGAGMDGIGEIIDQLDPGQVGSDIGTDALFQMLERGTELGEQATGGSGAGVGVQTLLDELDEQRERFNNRREEWEDAAEGPENTARDVWDTLNFTTDDEGDSGDSGGNGGGGGGGGSPSASDVLLNRYAEGEPLTPNLFDLPGEGDPAGYVEGQVDTAVGIVDPNDPRGFESPTNDLPETGEYGAVGDAVGDGLEGLKSAVDGVDSGIFEYRQDDDSDGSDSSSSGSDSSSSSDYFGDELNVEAEGTPVNDPEDDDDEPTLKLRDDGGITGGGL